MLEKKKDVWKDRMIGIAAIILGIPVALYGVVFMMKNIGRAVTDSPHAFTLFVGVFWLIVSFLPLGFGLGLIIVGFDNLRGTTSKEAQTKVEKSLAFFVNILLPILVILIGIAITLVGYLGGQVVQSDAKVFQYVFYVIGPAMVILAILKLFRVNLAWLGKGFRILWDRLDEKNLTGILFAILIVIILITWFFLDEIIKTLK